MQDDISLIRSLPLLYGAMAGLAMFFLAMKIYVNLHDLTEGFFPSP